MLLHACRRGRSFRLAACPCACKVIGNGRLQIFNPWQGMWQHGLLAAQQEENIVMQ